jgi:hypothetical protein
VWVLKWSYQQQWHKYCDSKNMSMTGKVYNPLECSQFIIQHAAVLLRFVESRASINQILDQHFTRQEDPGGNERKRRKQQNIKQHS